MDLSYIYMYIVDIDIQITATHEEEFQFIYIVVQSVDALLVMYALHPPLPTRVGTENETQP